MKPYLAWFLGTAYVLAALGGAGVLIWTDSYRDNSADPTPWELGVVITLTPIVIHGAVALGVALVGQIRLGHGLVLLAGGAVAGALFFGAVGMIGDAGACHDDDCVPLSSPLAVASLIGVWSLPLWFRLFGLPHYARSLMTGAVLGAAVGLATSGGALYLAIQRDDDFADLTVAGIVAVWTLPALFALGVSPLLRASAVGAGRRRRRTAGLLVAIVGAWFIALPPVAGVEYDAPALIDVLVAPGALLVGVGLLALAGARRAET